MRNQGIKVENNFVKGLLTENTALNFPENACTEAVNCVFKDGKVTRRGGIDLEENYTVLLNNSETLPSSDVFTEFMWTNVAGLGTVSLLVQQRGNRLHFFNVSGTTTVSSEELISTVDLDLFKVSGTPYKSDTQPCQYAQGNGNLIVVNRACDPIYVSYNPDTQTLTPVRITLKYRDFLGLTSYALNDRPSFVDINSLKTDATGVLHFYNLLNQGWWQGNISGGNPDANSALGQWMVARADAPSNADFVGYYRASFTDPFDSARVGSYDQGNTPAPKGHFILNVGSADRQAAMTAGGYTTSYSSTYDQFIPETTGSVIGNYTRNASAAFDGNTFQTIDVSSSINTPVALTATGTGAARVSSNGTTNTYTSINTYIGKNLGTAKRIAKIIAVPNLIGNTYKARFAAPPTGTAWFMRVSNAGTFNSFAHTINGTAYLYASNTAPASGTAGTLLGSTVLSPGQTSITITSSNTTSTFLYVWLYIVSDTFASSYFVETGVSEIKIYEKITASGSGSITATDITVERPQTVAFFSSRAWYSSIDAETLSNNLYFSQIIQKPEQFGLCYQQNDPTSEVNNQILPDDGGIIRIPEMGRVVRLFPYQTSLLVFASNGVWIIQSNNGFTASDFSIRQISSLGTNSPLSFVNVKGVPTWFGEEAILQINYNPQFDSFSVDSITDTTIKEFFASIPPSCRVWAKGAYDVKNNNAYWLYSSTENLEQTTTAYNSVLVLDTISGAFYPWTFGTSDVIINGITYVYDSVGLSEPRIKYTFTYSTATNIVKLGYAEIREDMWVDWKRYSQLRNNSTLSSSYESYFTTGYKVHGEAIKFVQPNYLLVYLEQQSDAGCYVQGVFDFTNNGDSGKWGTKQQIYNSALTHRDVNYRRLKIRGKGRSIQFKFTQDNDKPFTIIGWGGLETSNAEV